MIKTAGSFKFNILELEVYILNKELLLALIDAVSCNFVVQFSCNQSVVVFIINLSDTLCRNFDPTKCVVIAIGLSGVILQKTWINQQTMV